MERNIDHAITLEPKGVYFALRASTRLLRYGERIGNLHSTLDDEIMYDVRRSRELEPHNGVVAALAGHAHGFYFKNRTPSLELTGNAVKLAPGNGYCWALRATSLFYAGYARESYAAAKNAQLLTINSFFRPFIETVCCMTASIAGDVEAAIKHGEFAMQHNHRFRPTLNFLLAAYAHADMIPKAQIVLQKMMELEPDFSLSRLRLRNIQYQVRSVVSL